MTGSAAAAGSAPGAGPCRWSGPRCGPCQGSSDRPAAAARPLRGRSPRRSWCSRCSGTGCRRSPRGSRRRPARRRRRGRRVAAISIPGVQMPHWAPPVSRNAACSASSARRIAGPGRGRRQPLDRARPRAVDLADRHEAGIDQRRRRAGPCRRRTRLRRSPPWCRSGARSSRRTSSSRRMPGDVDLDRRAVDDEPVGGHRPGSRSGRRLRRARRAAGRRPGRPPARRGSAPGWPAGP